MTSQRKVALITGASKRIGAHIAQHLHQHHYDIVLHYRSTQEAANQLSNELNQQRADSCLLVQGDLADPSTWAHLSNHTQTWRQGLDLLVNNASAFYPSPIATATTEQWDDLFASNARGPYFLTQHCLPLLRASNGNVINIIDAMVNRPASDFELYAMAKSALVSLTQNLARQLAPEIRVNGVSPGAILWPEHDSLAGIQTDEQTKQAILEKIPLARQGDPNDIANTVRFLADSSYITGQIIAVDGGRSLV